MAVFQDNPAFVQARTHCGFAQVGDVEAYSVKRQATVATWTYLKTFLMEKNYENRSRNRVPLAQTTWAKRCWGADLHQWWFWGVKVVGSGAFFLWPLGCAQLYWIGISRQKHLGHYFWGSLFWGNRPWKRACLLACLFSTGIGVYYRGLRCRCLCVFWNFLPRRARIQFFLDNEKSKWILEFLGFTPNCIPVRNKKSRLN